MKSKGGTSIADNLLQLDARPRELFFSRGMGSLRLRGLGPLLAGDKSWRLPLESVELSDMDTPRPYLAGAEPKPSYIELPRARDVVEPAEDNTAISFVIYPASEDTRLEYTNFRPIEEKRSRLDLAKLNVYKPCPTLGEKATDDLMVKLAILATTNEAAELVLERYEDPAATSSAMGGEKPKDRTSFEDLPQNVQDLDNIPGSRPPEIDDAPTYTRLQPARPSSKASSKGLPRGESAPERSPRPAAGERSRLGQIADELDELEQAVANFVPTADMSRRVRALKHMLLTVRPPAAQVRAWLERILLGEHRDHWLSPRHAAEIDRLVGFVGCMALSRELAPIRQALRERIGELLDQQDVAAAVRLVRPLYELVGPADEELERLLIDVLEQAIGAGDRTLAERALVETARFATIHPPGLLGQLKQKLAAHPLTPRLRAQPLIAEALSRR